MQQITLYHNPRCSKSRQALAKLTAHGITPHIIEYLKQPLNEKELTTLLEKLQLPAHAVIRKKEALIKEQGWAIDDLSQAELIRLLSQHPILLERPIIATATQAVIGRPTENMEKLL